MIFHESCVRARYWQSEFLQGYPSVTIFDVLLIQIRSITIDQIWCPCGRGGSSFNDESFHLFRVNSCYFDFAGVHHSVHVCLPSFERTAVRIMEHVIFISYNVSDGLAMTLDSD